jgi:U-box domain
MTARKRYCAAVAADEAATQHAPFDEDAIRFVQNGSLPVELVCPLTRALLREPVKTCEGIVYERAAIAACLRQQGRNTGIGDSGRGGALVDPITGTLMDLSTLVPCHHATSAVQAFRIAVARLGPHAAACLSALDMSVMPLSGRMDEDEGCDDDVNVDGADQDTDADESEKNADGFIEDDSSDSDQYELLHRHNIAGCRRGVSGNLGFVLHEQSCLTAPAQLPLPEAAKSAQPAYPLPARASPNIFVPTSALLPRLKYDSDAEYARPYPRSNTGIATTGHGQPMPRPAQRRAMTRLFSNLPSTQPDLDYVKPYQRSSTGIRITRQRRRLQKQQQNMQRPLCTNKTNAFIEAQSPVYRQRPDQSRTLRPNRDARPHQRYNTKSRIPNQQHPQMHKPYFLPRSSAAGQRRLRPRLLSGLPFMLQPRFDDPEFAEIGRVPLRTTTTSAAQARKAALSAANNVDVFQAVIGTYLDAKRRSYYARMAKLRKLGGAYGHSKPDVGMYHYLMDKLDALTEGIVTNKALEGNWKLAVSPFRRCLYNDLHRSNPLVRSFGGCLAGGWMALPENDSWSLYEGGTQPHKAPSVPISYRPPDQRAPSEHLSKVHTVFLVDDSEVSALRGARDATLAEETRDDVFEDAGRNGAVASGPPGVAGSAASRWDGARALLGDFAPIAARHDGLGMDIHFVHNPRSVQCVRTRSDVEKAFAVASMPTRGSCTPGCADMATTTTGRPAAQAEIDVDADADAGVATLGQRVSDILDAYFATLRYERRSVKPLNLVVVVLAAMSGRRLARGVVVRGGRGDGKETRTRIEEEEEADERAIMMQQLLLQQQLQQLQKTFAARIGELVAGGHSALQLGVEFVQVGYCPRAGQLLRGLGLAVASHHLRYKRDVVGTTTTTTTTTTPTAAGAAAAHAHGAECISMDGARLRRIVASGIEARMTGYLRARYESLSPLSLSSSPSLSLPCHDAAKAAASSREHTPRLRAALRMAGSATSPSGAIGTCGERMNRTERGECICK